MSDPESHMRDAFPVIISTCIEIHSETAPVPLPSGSEDEPTKVFEAGHRAETPRATEAVGPENVFIETVTVVVEERPSASPSSKEVSVVASRLDAHIRGFADVASPPRSASRLSFDSAGGDTGGLFGFDIGGSLAKLVLFVPHDHEHRLKPLAVKLAAFLSSRGTSATTSFIAQEDLTLHLDVRGSFLFMCFECKDIERVLDIVELHDLARGMRTLSIAGGGAYRFETLLRERLGVEVHKEDELATVVHGVAFMLENSVDELYAIEHSRFGDESRMKRVPRNLDELYPFLLVNIGSGVSIIEVKDYYDFERVSGSALGGATYWGLCKLLTKYVSFDESMEAARCGEVNRVNLSVGDIYGGDYVEIGLPANITAAFFGKATRTDNPMAAGMQDADIAKALIQMIAQNVTQLAFLLAHMRNIQRVIFTGNFLRKNEIAQQTVSYSLAKWSELARGGGRMEALFLKHEGYFGAMGAFLANRTNAAGFVDVEGMPSWAASPTAAPPTRATLSSEEPSAPSSPAPRSPAREPAASGAGSTQGPG